MPWISKEKLEEIENRHDALVKRLRKCELRGYLYSNPYGWLGEEFGETPLNLVVQAVLEHLQLDATLEARKDVVVLSKKAKK